MARRFGYGFERKSEIQPSALTARVLFLESLPKLRQNVVVDLFKTALPAFNEVRDSGKQEIASIRETVQTEFHCPEIIGHTAIKRFLPNAGALQEKPSMLRLRDALGTWASSLNLEAEWFLDFGLAVLRSSCDTDDDHRRIALAYPEVALQSYLHKVWNESLIDLQSEACSAKSSILLNDPTAYLDAFHFKWETVEFYANPPFFDSLADWKEKIDNEFRQGLNKKPPRGAMTAFKLGVDDYIKLTQSKMAANGLIEPSTRWATGRHVCWLIDYQLPPGKRWSELATDNGVNEKTIRDGVKDLAALIGLDLREGDRPPGRPKGSRTKPIGSAGRAER